MSVLYRQRLPEVKYEPIGKPTISPHRNLFAFAGDPDAASKLQPVVERITVDVAHNHGPSGDEKLTYQIRGCQGIYLNLGDLDRPFRKELKKEPDIVHVAMGLKESYIALFKPETKEVVLAADTLIPINGSQPFRRFDKDGIITIGYAPPLSSLKDDKSRPFTLFVLWVTMFKVTKERPN